MPKRPSQDLPDPDNELPPAQEEDNDLLDALKALVAKLYERFGPAAEHPIFLWSWYALPDPPGGYLVLPSHVDVPIDPIEPPFESVEPPTPGEVSSD